MQLRSQRVKAALALKQRLSERVLLTLQNGRSGQKQSSGPSFVAGYGLSGKDFPLAMRLWRRRRELTWETIRTRSGNISVLTADSTTYKKTWRLTT